MIVQRGLLHSLKLRKLELISGNPAAVKWLLALWGYCEQNKAQTRYPDMSADRFADACGEALIPGDQLLTFLIDSRWVEMDGKTVVVRKFEEYNSGLLQRHQASEKSARIRAERAGKPYVPPAMRPPSDRKAPGERPLSDRRAMNEGMNKERAVGPKSGEKDSGGIVAGKLQLLTSSQTEAVKPEPERQATIREFGRLAGDLAKKLRAGDM